MLDRRLAFTRNEAAVLLVSAGRDDLPTLDAVPFDPAVDRLPVDPQRLGRGLHIALGCPKRSEQDLGEGLALSCFDPLGCVLHWWLLRLDDMSSDKLPEWRVVVNTCGAFRGTLDGEMGDTSTTKAIQARLQELVGPSRGGGTKELADGIGVPLGTVDRYIRGDRTPPHDFLVKVADWYEITLDNLYGRSSGGVEEADQRAPSWARRLDARVRYVERLVKAWDERLSPTAPGAWRELATLAAQMVTAQDIGEVEAHPSSRPDEAPVAGGARSEATKR